jgi:hypothetical protein
MREARRVADNGIENVFLFMSELSRIESFQKVKV